MTDFIRAPAERFRNLNSFTYQPHFVKLQFNGMQMAVIDEKTADYIEGKSPTFLCLHGVPTWSYLYRHFIPVLLASNKSHQKGVRVICPDFFGFGRSDIPTNPSVHSLTFHRNSIIQLVLSLNATNITLIAQDWGGLIGLTLPMHPEMTSRFRRVIVFNTFIPNGNNTTSGFRKWRNYVTNPKNKLNAGNIVNASCRNREMGSKYGGLTSDEINAYNAPFPDESYQLALRQFPAMVPLTVNDDGIDIWNQSRLFWEKNRDKLDDDHKKIKIFMAHGCRDVVFTFDSACSLFRTLISKTVDPSLGTAMECGGILFVPDASHFLQESVSIQWMIRKALKYFGDIPYDAVETEWVLSRNHDRTQRDIHGNLIPNVRILKIILNHHGVHPQSKEVVHGLYKAFDYAESNDFCRGMILIANTKDRMMIRKKRPVFSAGLDLKVMATNNKKLVKNYLISIRELWRKMHSLGKPLISAVNGDAIAGGALLALAGDYRIGYNDCCIQMSEAQIGVGCNRAVAAQIERVTGSMDKAGYVLQTGLPFSGQKALEYNLLSKCCENEVEDGMNWNANLIKECISVLEYEYFNGQMLASASAKRMVRQHILDIIDQDVARVSAETKTDFLSDNVQRYIHKTIKSRL